MSHTWIVDYEMPDGEKAFMRFDTEQMANEWCSYHNGWSFHYNIEVRRVTNWKPISPQSAAAMTGQLGAHGEGTAVPADNACPHCGLIHTTTCHRIKAMEYYPDGSLKRIELHEPRPLNPENYVPLLSG